MRYPTSKITAGIFFCYFSWPSLLAATIEVVPGAYEITAETLLPHLHENLRNTTVRSNRCLSKPDATSLFPVLEHRSFAGCSLVSSHREQNKFNFELICQNSEAASGTAHIVVKSSGFHGLLDIKMGGKNMKFSQRINGYRLGGCKP